MEEWNWVEYVEKFGWTAKKFKGAEHASASLLFIPALGRQSQLGLPREFQASQAVRPCLNKQILKGTHFKRSTMFNTQAIKQEKMVLE